MTLNVLSAELARIPSLHSKTAAYSHSIFVHADGDAVAFLFQMYPKPVGEKELQGKGDTSPLGKCSGLRIRL